MKPVVKVSHFILVLALCFVAFSAQAQFTKLKDKTDPVMPPGGGVDVNETVVPPAGGSPTPTTTTSSSSSTGAVNCHSNNPLPEGMVCLNGVDLDIKDMVKTMSELLGYNFMINDKVKGKITIISDKPMTKKIAYEAFLSALEVNGFTTVQTPSGLIEILPHKDSLSKPSDLYIGDENKANTDKFITRIIQLSNISASEISGLIKSMVTKGQIIPYATTNSLIITDTGANIDYIVKLIKQLDTEGPQEVLQIVPIINADAKDVADKISQIFGDSASKGSSTSSTSRVKRSKTSTSESEGLPSIKKVISDERTNSVILMGSKQAIVKVMDLIAKLDRTIEGVEGSIHVYYLKHANAKELAEVLSSLVSDSKSSSKKDSKTSSSKKTTTDTSSSSAVTLEGGVKVTADEATNSLIVVASPKDFTTLVDKVIAKLDIVRPQVYLEAVIMSLDVTKSMSLGVSLLGGALNTLTGGNQMTAFGSVLPTASSALSTIAGLSGGFGGGIVSTDTVDFTLSDGSTVSVPAVSGIIQAVAEDTDTNVLSTPSIMTLDNQEATIQVGQEVPVPSGSTITSGVTSFDVEREDTGIILKIKPQISESNNVRLEISQEISTVLPNADATLGPTLDKKTVETVVVAKDKQTIVIGGLIDDAESITSSRVPLLGDVPVLGNLFKTKTRERSKTNLIVFITPYVIRDREDYLVVLKKKIEERNAFINLNYGSGQRKSIRDSIQRHASDLLEFSCTNKDPGNPCVSQMSYTTDSSSPNTATVDNSGPKVDDKKKKPRFER